MTELDIHESGHAIMFDALDIPMEFVTVAVGCGGEEASLEGCVRLADENNPAGDIVMAALAGPGASFFIAGVADKDSIERYKSDQRHLQRIHADQADAGRQDEYWSRLMAFLYGPMRVWLLENRAVIVRFATMLSAAQTLRGEPLRQALDSAWSAPKPDLTLLREALQDLLST